MVVAVLVAVWLLLLPVVGVLCARVLGFGERPSAPRPVWTEDVPVTSPSTTSSAEALTRTS